MMSFGGLGGVLLKLRAMRGVLLKLRAMRSVSGVYALVCCTWLVVQHEFPRKHIISSTPLNVDHPVSVNITSLPKMGAISATNTAIAFMI